ncbi:uncharacterized protein FOMMEDRAFT_152715 [Fomitiporia mediterranea MF3/22]|uniref:uncharacterized protein n=1 Tax=Fomitiporia mediterranea (strain MF3/22) TaxID=694068 RepID=UPI0004407DAA|nr:uncharacterized protein FOMMEDRAFT_152715 [Fomitiporia mediterranea MF3/22]EJD05411.1 hypothetical protein FOMMEDRAFT_152715 [Fomitiporia mediterranea MF3/22]
MSSSRPDLSEKYACNTSPDWQKNIKNHDWSGHAHSMAETVVSNHNTLSSKQPLRSSALPVPDRRVTTRHHYRFLNPSTAIVRDRACHLHAQTALRPSAGRKLTSILSHFQRKRATNKGKEDIQAAKYPVLL